MSDNIKVVVKVRPLISRELEDKLSLQWRVNNNSINLIDPNGRNPTCFTFDKVYDHDSKISDIYNDIAKPIVEAATRGFNGTIFAYGQTSSGKTYTMTGTENSPGIIPIAVCDLFDIIKEIPDRDFLVRVSYIEIYNETIKDLLNTKKKNIKIQENYQGIKVDCSEHVTTSPDEVLNFLTQGELNRQTGATNMNEESSRSHSIFQITIESQEHIEGKEEVGCVNVSTLNLVDLAGSERAGQTGATGLRFKEGTHINKSLSTLALVIKQLSEEETKFINYRDSKLTRILQNSLGGNAKTSIICAVTPAAVDETISTLQFANRAKAIKNKPEVNAVATDATMMQDLTKQLSKLQSELESKKNLEVMLESKKNVEQDNLALQKKISALQRLILNGFGQRSSMDIVSGARRKLVQSRRITISTLHSIDEDHVPILPKFHTPSLKYNPANVPEANVDFLPIQNANKLSCVPEDNENRLITPPPTKKVVNFNDEVIEVDSDDEEVKSNIQTCSPFHKCYVSSKTPPCVLREKANIAEKKFKDIVEFTEREKVFEPHVVELIEKLEQKTDAITQLQEEINNFHKISKEKDLVIDQLKAKITKSNEEVKAVVQTKAELESLCKEYTTKLTDMEFSLETLKNKSDRREKELLSLLEEQKMVVPSCKKLEDYNSIPLLSNKDNEFNFMDLSKDISLVNSEYESSMINVNEEGSSESHNSIADLQKELTLKNNKIFELETNLTTQKETISLLENSYQELQHTTENLKEKLNLYENENCLLKATLETQNSTIDSQKESVQSMQSNIESYKYFIKDMQIKLTNKQPQLNINDNDLDTMKSNEEKLIANNEDIKTIINSTKMLLESREKDIQLLQSELSTLSERNSELTKELSINETESNNKIKYLENQIDTNTSQIEKLMHENHSLKEIESYLKQELCHTVEAKNCAEQDNKRLENIVCQKSVDEKDNTDLKEQIISLENKLRDQDSIIASIKKEELLSRRNFEAAFQSMKAIKKIFDILCVDNEDTINYIQSNENTISMVDEHIGILEGKVKDVISQKDIALHKNLELKDDLEKLKIEHVKEMHGLQTEIELLKQESKDSCFKTKCVSNLEANLIQFRIENDNLKSNLSNLESVISSHKNDIFLLTTERDESLKLIEDMHKQISKLNSVIESNSNTTRELQQKIEENDIESSLQIKNLKEKCEEILQNCNQKLNNIFLQTCDIIDNNSIDNSKDISDSSIIYDKIISNLHNISDYIHNHSSVEINKINAHLMDAKKEITDLREKNSDFSKIISDIESNRNNFISELETIKVENMALNKELVQNNCLIKLIQNDLKENSSDVQHMMKQTTDLNDHYSSLGDIMKCEFEHKEVIDNSEAEMLKENWSPSSLLSICCKKVFDAIQPSEDSIPSTNSNISIDKPGQCNCIKELEYIQGENKKLSILIEQLKLKNEYLLSEREEVREEIRLLLEPSLQLQKKINSHKTNLSTLTAMTYAENKLLKSRVTVLQHHHSRYHNICNKDLPLMKKQLHNLLTILNCDNTCIEKHNVSLKRYSLPSVLLDSTSATNNLRNESTLDGDLLMLDTNITLTSADNTLMIDQSCSELDAINANDDCQMHDTATHINENLSMLHEIKELADKNTYLENENIELMKKIKESTHIDSGKTVIVCDKCVEYKQRIKYLENELENISQELKNVNTLKENVEEQNIKLSQDNIMTKEKSQKYELLQSEFDNKNKEISRLCNLLKNKNVEFNRIQEENDSLSTQLMENISDNEHLNTELNILKESNIKLTDKCSDLEKQLNESKIQVTTSLCTKCATLKDIEHHSKLNRSLSDSETSSRHNKICTLQNELHAGREDCIELTEEVVTIKNQLERSSISIDNNIIFDDSMGESNNYSFNKRYQSVESPRNKFKTSNVRDGSHLDFYNEEKLNVLNYFVEKTGIDKENLDCNITIIDLLKMFYNNLVTKHGNEVENLLNKIRCFEESKLELGNHIQQLSVEYARATELLQEKENKFETVTRTLTQIKQSITLINKEMSTNNTTIIVTAFKEKILRILNQELDLDCVDLFEKIVDSITCKHQNDLADIMGKYTKLQGCMENVCSELQLANNNLSEMKCKLTEKEKEFNLLKEQKEKIHEISEAVTLDIIRKEQDLLDTVLSGCKRLVQQNILHSSDFDFDIPLNRNMKLILDRIITESQKVATETETEKASYKLEIEKAQSTLEENQKTIHTMKIEHENLKITNNNISMSLKDMAEKLKVQETSNETLNQNYNTVVNENKVSTLTISRLRDELNTLKQLLFEKEDMLNNITATNAQNMDNLAVINDLTSTIDAMKVEIDNLKTVNNTIMRDKESCARDLMICQETLKLKGIELDKMTADIKTLHESIEENKSVVEDLQNKAKSLWRQNQELQAQLKEKCNNCVRLQENIKTQEKTTEIQSKIVLRLQKQKKIDDETINELSKKITTLTQQHSYLLNECEAMKITIKTTSGSLEKLKESFEFRMSDGVEDSNGPKSRNSIEAVATTTRRRRQSIHDSMRTFNDDCRDLKEAELEFDVRHALQDSFMDVDHNDSNRSSPFTSGRGRDSLSRQNESDLDKEHNSRPSSMQDTRRRRQSIHGLHRTNLQHSPERPHVSQIGSHTNDISGQSDVTVLRNSLSSCQQQLEELKEKYRELDEECETCAQYLRERDEQCSKLKKEKQNLEGVVAELKEKLLSVNHSRAENEVHREVSDACVNTDEDWTNLHSVVVDRMSYDAEVEKNKRLTKIIEELRFKKQDLQNTLAKTENALSNSGRSNTKELESTKSELRTCRQELKELKERYKELDEECETCAEYLREREEQCRDLKKAKATLEAKLNEILKAQDDSSNVQSIRNRRRSTHDKNRLSATNSVEAATEMSEDFLNSQVERDSDTQSIELKKLKSAVDKLTQQKQLLENQILSAVPAPSPMYIATGSAIVQNQQLTDVMKENQKLKKINTKLVHMCKKRGKKSDIENQEI